MTAAQDPPISRHNQAKVHETPHEYLKVLEDVDHITGRDLALCRGSALIRAKAGFDVRPLLLAQPFRIFGEVRDDEEEDEGHKASQYPFKNEDPPPSLIAPHTAHLANGTGE